MRNIFQAHEQLEDKAVFDGLQFELLSQNQTINKLWKRAIIEANLDLNETCLKNLFEVKVTHHQQDQIQSDS